MKKSPVDKLSYEQAFSELEEVVGLLEMGQSSLEEALKLYERGQSLTQHCTELLNQAEIKVRTLNGDILSAEDDAGALSQSSRDSIAQPPYAQHPLG